jgi:nitroreductase
MMVPPRTLRLLKVDHPMTNHSAFNGLRELLRRRHSARAFLNEPVPRALIESALEVAAQSPSWCNTQPWQVVVTNGKGTEAFRKALSDHAVSAETEPDFAFPARYAGVYQERRLETAFQLYDSVGIARGDRDASAGQAAKNFELFGAPHAVLVTTEADLGVYGAVDCGIFTGSFLLALEGLGIAAVPQAALAAYAPFIREYFGLPDTRRVLCGISLGWKDEEHQANTFRTGRAQVSDFVRWVD